MLSLYDNFWHATVQFAAIVNGAQHHLNGSTGPRWTERGCIHPHTKPARHERPMVMACSTCLYLCELKRTIFPLNARNER